jgi:PAS domain S-box-containing protein
VIGTLRDGDAGLRLREPHADFRRVFEGNPFPMWIFDLDSLAILEVNDAAVRHYGYSREEFLRLTLRELRPKDDVPRLHDHLPRTRDNPSPGTTIWRHRTKDGTLIDVEVTSFHITLGRRPAKVVIVNDVTALHRAERTIRSLRSEVASAQERRRITLELPDGIAQSLASLLLGLGKLEEARSHDDARVGAAERTSAPQLGDLALLTRRERKVLERVAEGYTSREIAEELELSIKSVEAYRARVMNKLGLRSRVELVRHALECGLLRPGKPAR